MELLRKLKAAIPQDFFFRVWWHQLEGWVGAALYGFPSRRLRVIGVTGTDGKTTTVHMVAAILQAAKKRVGIATTTHFQVGERRWENKTHQTTLGRFQLHRLLRQMVREKCDYAVIEMSSHALHQGRLNGVSVDSACITNITHEHLDYHRTFEAYVQAKALLFHRLKNSLRKRNTPKVAVINLDIPQWHEFARIGADELYGYSTSSHPDAKTTDTVWASDIQASHDATVFTMHIGQSSVRITLPMIGVFNVSNALAAAAVCVGQRIPLDVIKSALERFHSVDGRMDRIDEGQDFDVYVDFAVTPGALKSVYRALRAVTKGKVISVFGATGHRDQSKWPVAGELAATLTDMVVVTDDEPYTDDPAFLRSLVMQRFSSLGKQEGSDFVEIPDRLEAIKYALTHAKKGDSVVITGMGNFQYRVIGDKNMPWDEREIVRQCLRACLR